MRRPSDCGMRILLIEDDAQTADYVARGLVEAGNVCDVTADGQDGLFQATREPTTWSSSTACCPASTACRW